MVPVGEPPLHRARESVAADRAVTEFRRELAWARRGQRGLEGRPGVGAHDEVTLSVHRRFTATSRPRNEWAPLHLRQLLRPGTTLTTARFVPAKGPPTIATAIVWVPGGSGRRSAEYAAATNVACWLPGTPRMFGSGR